MNTYFNIQYFIYTIFFVPKSSLFDLKQNIEKYFLSLHQISINYWQPIDNKLVFQLINFCFSH